MKRSLELTLLAVLLACGCRSTTHCCAGLDGLPRDDRQIVVGGRGVTLRLKPGPEVASRPLLILLHGYGASGAELEAYLGAQALVEQESLILAAPDGTLDPQGLRFWNAGEVCCNFFADGVDDVAYLMALIAEVKRRFRVDDRRVFVAGHSNGGFMALRLACANRGEIAAVISLAGADSAREEECRPAVVPSVLQVHGDADDIVRYAGGSSLLGRGGPAYPGAVETVRRWGRRGDCSSELEVEAGGLDLDTGLDGSETRVEKVKGCPAGRDVRLWTVRGGLHLPGFSPRFLQLAWQWLMARPRS